MSPDLPALEPTFAAFRGYAAYWREHIKPTWPVRLGLAADGSGDIRAVAPDAPDETVVLVAWLDLATAPALIGAAQQRLWPGPLHEEGHGKAD